MEDGIPAGTEPLRVLIAEDDPAHASLLHHTLRKRGHAGDLVSDGEALLRAVAGSRYDVVLVDLHLPRVGGIEAAAWIRRHHDDDDRPVLIAVTAERDAAVPEWVRQAGFDALFTKPLDTQALLDELARARRRRPAPAAA